MEGVWTVALGMNDAALSALHSELASQEAERGAHGGLGFAKKSGTKKEAKGTVASRTLLDGGDKKKQGGAREFHTTTAGAVAAGHWDPWSRPVEFKMNQVNRRVGGLYSMFVKGGTVGAELEKPAAAASAAPAPKAKEKKRDKAAKRAATKEAAAPSVAESAGGSFNFKKAIRKQLRAEGGQMRLKSLRVAVLAEHAQAVGSGCAADPDAVKQRFKRKLTKMNDVGIDGRQVRLTM